MTVAQDVGALIIGYDDDDDAVRIANDSLYGLSGAVWSGDQQRAVNSVSPAGCAPAPSTSTAADSTSRLRSVATSSPGYGRENGVYGIEEFSSRPNRSSSMTHYCRVSLLDDALGPLLLDGDDR